MKGFKFDTQKLEKLNDPERLKDIPPDYIIGKLNVKSPEIIVDIGAGTGFFSKEFARIPTVKKVYALDIADEMIEWMKEKVIPEYSNIVPLKMKETSTNLPENTADIVIMINLHHEFHEPIAILNDAYRILKDPGKMAIVDWAKKETEHGPPLAKRYTTEQVLNQLEHTKFKNAHVYDDMTNHFLITVDKIAK